MTRHRAPSSQGAVAIARHYRAPELCLGEPANFPVDLWAYGCILEELAHRRLSFNGESDYHVLDNMLKRFGTPDSPHPLITPWRTRPTRCRSLTDTHDLPIYKPNIAFQETFNAVPLVVAAVSSPY